MKELPTFKDNDFLDEGCKLYLPDDAKQKLLDMLSSDTAVSDLYVGVREGGVDRLCCSILMPDGAFLEPYGALWG